MSGERQQRLLQRFGDAVRKRRLELHWSQEELAEFADLHRTYIADIERGKRNVSLVNIVKIADALQINASKLMDGLTLTAR